MARVRYAPAAIAGVLLLMLGLAACSGSNDSPSSSAPALRQGGAAGNGQGQPLAPGQTGAGGQGKDDAAPPSAISGEIDANHQPQSTFAVDVDTASYGFVR